jgi:phosphate-selective porin OprO/OprP
MRQLLLRGVALLAVATSAHAQITPPSDASKVDAPLTDSNAKTTDVTGRSATPPAAMTAPERGSGLDTTIPADDTPPPPPPSTGNLVLDRLNALEAKVTALEARNHELEAQAAETQTRVQKVEVRAAKGVQPGVSPTFADVNDNFTFKARGMLQLDYAHYSERAGGYNYNDGTDIRRGRFGFDGTAFKVFKYRIEAEFVKGTVNLLDAYLQYQPTPNLVLTVGQHKAPYGLEANSSDAFNEFLERGMANVAFGAVGAERRVGASLAYQSNKLNAQVGLFGAGEAVQRSTNPNTPDETVGINGRVTFDPILDQGRLLHVGVSAYHVGRIGSKTLTLADRPGTRVDGGNIESVTLAPVTTGAIANQTRGVSSATFVGGEGAGVYGPFSVQGEFGHLHVDRYGSVPDLNFRGGYVFGSFFITGESRVFKNGVIDRLKPFSDFNPFAHHWGAWEIAARYDYLNLTDHDFSPLKRNAETLTGALNWYLNPNMKILFNYIRVKGLNSPLVVAPVALNGTTAKGDTFATRLHVDF